MNLENLPSDSIKNACVVPVRFERWFVANYFLEFTEELVQNRIIRPVRNRKIVLKDEVTCRAFCIC